MDKFLKITRFALAGAIFGIALTNIFGDIFPSVPSTHAVDLLGSGAGAVVASLAAKMAHAI